MDGWNKWHVVCCVVAIIASIFAATCFAYWSADNWHYAHARDQIEAFESALKECEDADEAAIATKLKFVLGYYPSGTKHETGSSVDRIVEFARRSTVANMIGLLRKKSGLDLGDDPDAWIRHFAK